MGPQRHPRGNIVLVDFFAVRHRGQHGRHFRHAFVIRFEQRQWLFAIQPFHRPKRVATADPLPRESIRTGQTLQCLAA